MLAGERYKPIYSVDRALDDVEVVASFTTLPSIMSWCYVFIIFLILIKKKIILKYLKSIYLFYFYNGE